MGYTRSVDRPRGAWLPLAAAALVVPTALAGLTLLWPRPQIEDGLASAAGESLTAAGITGAVTLSGRDAVVSGVPGADAQRAEEVVRGVTGMRVARAEAGPDAPPAVAPREEDDDDETVPTGELDAAAKQRLDAALDGLLTATPITFEPDSSALTGPGAATVARVLELVAAAPGARLQVDGFVATGPGDGRLTAQELSDARAGTVRDALAAGGVPADRVTVRGLGEGQNPVPDVAGRRVDITVA